MHVLEATVSASMTPVECVSAKHPFTNALSFLQLGLEIGKQINTVF